MSLSVLLGLGIVVGSGLLIRGLWLRDWEISATDEQALATTMGTAAVAICLSAATASASAASWVLSGVASWGMIAILLSTPVRDRMTESFGGPESRIMGWGALAVGSIVGPMLVTATPYLLYTRFGIAAVAALMQARAAGEQNKMKNPCSENNHSTERIGSDD